MPGLALRGRGPRSVCCGRHPPNIEIVGSCDMGLFSKDIASMDDLFVHQLQDIYYAEKRIVGALPDMIAKASSPELKSAFEAHLGQTKNHVKRVEQVSQMHGAQPKQVDCPARDGILEEADEDGRLNEDQNVVDVVIIRL